MDSAPKTARLKASGVLAGMAAAGAIAVCAATPLLFPLDGKPHADLPVFLGRFHPVLLHTPVALLSLAPFFEIAGCFRRWSGARPIAGVLVTLGALTALPVALIGYALAYGTGLNSPLVVRHMWGGVALAVLALLCVAVRTRWIRGGGIARRVYPFTLLATFGLLGWTAHQGGAVSHGEEYLTEYLPAPLRKTFGLAAKVAPVTASPDSAYALTVAPVLEKNCVECHTAAKAKGGLRLDNIAFILKGGSDGPAVIPGSPEGGELLRRVSLAAEDPKVMPPDGKKLLSADEIAALKSWVAQGATPTVPPAVGIALAKEPERPALPQVGDYAGLRAEMAATAKRFGVSLVPVSRTPGDGLILRTYANAEKFDDAALAAFDKFAPYIVEAELACPKLGDASVVRLAGYKNLRVLHLEHTAITGAGLGELAGLRHLEYLNINDTKVTSAALAAVKKIKRLYAYGTPGEPAPAPEPTAKPKV